MGSLLIRVNALRLAEGKIWAVFQRYLKCSEMSLSLNLHFVVACHWSVCWAGHHYCYEKTIRARYLKNVDSGTWVDTGWEDLNDLYWGMTCVVEFDPGGCPIVTQAKISRNPTPTVNSPRFELTLGAMYGAQKHFPRYFISDVGRLYGRYDHV